MVCYWWRHLWCTVALLTLHAGLTRVVMSSAGAAMQVHKHSTNEDIIEYLQQFEDYRLPVVIECFRDKDAWKQELSEEAKSNYRRYWSAEHLKARDFYAEVPTMINEETTTGTVHRKIDVALLFLQEIKRERKFNVDKVIEALRLIRDTGDRRPQVPNAISLAPTVVLKPQSGSVRFDAEEEFGPLGDGPNENNHVASRKTSSQRFIAPDTVTTSEDEESDTDDDNKQLLLRFW